MSTTTSDIAAGRRMKVEIEIDVVELSEEEKDECREQFGADGEDDDDGDELFSVDSYSAGEVAEVIESAFHEENVREMFAGSNLYVTFANARVVGAHWIAAPSQIEEG